MHFRTSALFLTVVVLSACDSASERTISGTFEASQQIDVSTVTTSIVLPTVVDGEAFTFSTSLTILTPDGDADTETLAGTGTYDHPRLALTAGDGTVTGSVSEDGESFTVSDEDGVLTFTRR